MTLHKKILICFFSLFTFFLFGQGKVNPNYHYVKPHVRNGTYVPGHYRTNPNSTNRDNYSTRGNTNPWTGKPGWIPPDNKPLPSYGTSTWTTTDYQTTIRNTDSKTQSTNTWDWTPPLTTFSYPESKRIPSSFPRNTSESASRSISYIAGPKTIHYLDGKEIFNVLGTSKTEFKPNLTYYYYDPVEDEVLTAKGRAYGQLLDGFYRLIGENGELLIESNYKRGLRHGYSIYYDSNGEEESVVGYNEGVVVYFRSINEDGETVEWNGAPFKKNSVRKFSKDGITTQKEEYLSESKWINTDYDPESGRKLIEAVLSNGLLDGPFKAYHTDGRTVKKEGMFLKDELHGKIKSYSENGVLLVVENFLEGKKDGPYEVRNHLGQIIQKGVFKNDLLHGIQEIYDLDENIHEKRTYSFGKQNGSYEKRIGQLPLVKGTFLNDEPHGKWEYFVYEEEENRSYPVAFFNYKYGLKNGAFKEVRNDSIIIGTYQNDLLQGKLKIYQPFGLWLLGRIPEHIEEDQIIAKGEMYNGKMTGEWKFYDLTQSLIEEGNYLNGNKHGEWKYYYSKYVDQDHNPTEYAGKLYLKENYLNGQLNGKSESFSFLDKIQVPCDTTIGTVNPLDTCFRLNWTKNYELSYYKNGILHGPYEVRDSENLIAKGNFLNGKKDGAWTFRDDAGSVTEGNFHADQKYGIWTQYYPEENVVFRKTNYSDGLREGVSIQYDYSGKKSNQTTFKNNKIQSVIEFDSLTQEPSFIYENIEYREEFCYFRKTFFSEDTVASLGIKMVYLFSGPETDQVFFMKEVESYSHIPHGEFSFTKINGEKILTGEFANGLRINDWDYYYYAQQVRRTITFEDDEKKSESYWILSSGQPFSGHFYSFTENGKIRAKIQVKNGLRHGKTKVYQQNGKLENVKKYKKGELIE